MKLSTAALSLAFAFPVLKVQICSAHGELMSPRSRNWYAHQEGIEGLQGGKPSREYCPHCLNTNPDTSGVCGESTNYDYNKWLDSLGDHMPWISQETYTLGQTIVVESFLTAHHGGHMEMKACPVTDSSAVPPQSCFDNNLLEFISDDLYSMPMDPNYPERGYYAGGQGASTDRFVMKFKLPENVYGDKVLLQWRYITANSCSPPGYADYFGNNADLSNEWWSPTIPDCQLPYPQDGTRLGVWPEQFWNCAEVTILGPGGTLAPVAPTPSPTNTSTVSPTTPVGCCSEDYKTCDTNWITDASTCTLQGFQWLSQGALTNQCVARWSLCMEETDICCPGLTCSSNLDGSAMECQVVESSPETSGSSTTTESSVESSISSTETTTTSTGAASSSTTTIPSNNNAAGCCSQNLKECVSWCGSTVESCTACGSDYVWLDQGAQVDCLSRWSDCTSDHSSCCSGMVCNQQTEWWWRCDPE